MSDVYFAVELSAPYKITIREFTSIDPPGKEEVTVKTVCSGISAGTEMLAYRGELPDGIMLDANIEGMKKQVNYPMEYGYSCVGEVIAVGDAAHQLLIGKKVFAFNSHKSIFTEPIERLIMLPDNLAIESGIFLPNMETAVGLVMDGAPMLGESVLVLGLGVVGQMLALLLQQYPLNKLTLVDPLLKRRSIVDCNGITEVVSELKPVIQSTDSYDLVYEMSGKPEALNTAIAHAGYKGRIVVGSWYGSKNVNLDLGSHFHRSKISIYSSQVSEIDPVHSGRWDKKRRTDLALMMLGRTSPTYLISHQYHVRNASNAYRKLDKDKDPVQVLLTYD